MELKQQQQQQRQQQQQPHPQPSEFQVTKANHFTDTNAGTLEIPEDQENKFINHPPAMETTTPVTPFNPHAQNPRTPPTTSPPRFNQVIQDTDTPTPIKSTDTSIDSDRRTRRRRDKSQSPEEISIKTSDVNKSNTNTVSGPSGANKQSGIPMDMYFEEDNNEEWNVQKKKTFKF